MRLNFGTRVILSYLIAVFLLGLIVDHFLVAQIQKQSSLLQSGSLVSSLRWIFWCGVMGWMLFSLVLSRIYFKRLKRVVSRWRRLDKRFEKTPAVALETENTGDDLEKMTRWMNEMSKGLERKIGELTRERNQLQTILDTLQEGLLLLDAEGNIALHNPSARALLGIGQHAVGKPPIEVIRNPDLQSLVDLSLSGEEVKNREIRIIRNHQEVFLLVQASPLAGGIEGRGAILAFVDITHLRRLERMRRDFVDNVSHELKTPLTSIQGYVETLIDGAFQDPEQAKHFLGVIDANARRLSNLVEDLLRLSEIESQKFTPLLEEMPVASLFEEVVQLHEVQLKKKEIEVVYKTHLETITSDRSALLNILENLLDNAIKYGNAQSQIRMDCESRGANALFSVSNEGMGVEQAHLDRIFERFYRVDKSRSRQEGGTGLGLAIVKHLVQLLHGEVWAESSYGSGCTFYFSVPNVP